LKDFALYPLVKKQRASRTFVVGGLEYRYFTHHYNATWKNERAVEIALVTKFLSRCRGDTRFLEIGNVLSYYLDIPHLVVDKYEPSPNVINEDILTFGSPESFDVIVSISTLEHVGWDEAPRDPRKVRLALDHMKDLLAPGGSFFLSFPIGYNAALDRIVLEREVDFREIRYLKRTSRDNHWEEVGLEDMRSAEYDKPFPCANALFVG